MEREADWPVDAPHYNAKETDREVVERLALYLRNRISPESKVWHFMPMANECWNFIHEGG